MFKQCSKIAVSLLVGCLFLAQGVALANSSMEENIYLKQSESVRGDFIRAGSNVDVSGEVSGDNIAVGNTMTFSGRTGGDVLSAGNTIKVTGNTAGNVRAAGSTVILESVVEKNVTVFAGSVLVEKESEIKGNLYVFGGEAKINGKVDGNAYVYTGNLVFAGDVRGDAVFEADKIDLREEGHIGGKLSYKTKAGQEVQNSQIATGGAVRTGNTEDSTSRKEGYNWGGTIWKFFSLLLIVFILFKLFRRQMLQMFGPVQPAEIWGKVATGLLSLIVNPVVIVISLITLIGIPFGILLTIMYIVIIILAKVIAPILVGKMINSRAKVYNPQEQSWWLDFILGFVAMELIGVIPYIGWALLALVFLFAFGRVTTYIWGVIRRNQTA